MALVDALQKKLMSYTLQDLVRGQSAHQTDERHLTVFTVSATHVLLW